MSSPGDPNPIAPEFYQDGRGWVTGYLVVHMMSTNSYRYAYSLWLAILLAFVLFTAFHWTGIHNGFLGATWTKWAIRRRTWRKATGHPISLPSNGQLLCLTFLPLAAILLCFIGPDYISPTAQAFDITARDSQYWDTNMYAKYAPTYTINKNWWTMGSRIGIMSFALFPICVLFALKAPPFAVLAIRFTTQLYFDKLAWLHRWTGRLIWLATVAHVTLWSVQLAKDTRPNTGITAYSYAWSFPRFLWGWVAFGCLTLLVILSFPFLRKPHYETFYYAHVVLAAATLALSALHHPPIAMWCWVALGLWAAERIHRFLRWLYINAIVTGPDQIKQPKPPSVTPPTTSQFQYPPSPSFLPLSREQAPLIPSSEYNPPPGYAHAELVSGATVRLTYISPKPISWAPGQHFLINVPSVSYFTTHPFTVASACDEQAPSRTLVFLVRCKAGWTRDLWHHIAELSYRGLSHAPGENLPVGTVAPKAGTLLRMYVDGPFGSSVRANWGAHSTVLIITGGSGVSFGLSILEYVSLCLAGRDPKHLGSRPSGWGSPSSVTQRVRFIWLVREFAHLQWCASILRRCQSMVPRRTLQIDIFVTNFTPPTLPRSVAQPLHLHEDISGNVLGSPKFSTLAPPEHRFQPPKPTSSDEELDLSYYTGHFGDEESNGGDLEENYTVDLTEFDGDNDVILPGEDVLNRRVGKVSKIRRAKTKRSMYDASPLPGPRKDRHRLSGHSTDGLLASDWTSTHSHDSGEFDLGRMTPLTLEERGSLPRLDNNSSAVHAQLQHLPASPSPLHATTNRNPPSSRLQVNTDMVSLSRPSTPTSVLLTSPATPTFYAANQDTHPKLRVDEQELRDVSVMSELARSGKPRLDRILSDEVEKARGSVAVACCGPTSLNALVRKAIAQNIDPQRVRGGDGRGLITLVSEDFAY